MLELGLLIALLSSLGKEVPSVDLVFWASGFAAVSGNPVPCVPALQQWMLPAPPVLEGRVFQLPNCVLTSAWLWGPPRMLWNVGQEFLAHGWGK